MKRPGGWPVRKWGNAVLERLLRVPLGVWAALGAAFLLLELYLRGRRLDASLAQEKLRHVGEQVRATLAQDAFREEQHLQRVQAAQHRIEEIETARALVNASGAQEAKRLRTLDSQKVHAEYMKLLMKRWEALRPDPAFDIDPVDTVAARPRPRKPKEPPIPKK